MPRRGMVEKGIWADLEWISVQPKELLVHALSPVIRVEDSGGDNDQHQNRRRYRKHGLRRCRRNFLRRSESAESLPESATAWPRPGPARCECGHRHTRYRRRTAPPEPSPTANPASENRKRSGNDAFSGKLGGSMMRKFSPCCCRWRLVASAEAFFLSSQFHVGLLRCLVIARQVEHFGLNRRRASQVRLQFLQSWPQASGSADSRF